MIKSKKIFFSWILIGLLCRFIFMPFTLHPDMLHINYHPSFLALKGVWNIYNYHADFFKERYCHYYPPLTYLFFGSYLYLIRPFLPEMDSFMDGFREVADNGGGHSGHYLKGLPGDRLFRFLFLMKLPYLFFDLGLLWLLVKFIPRLYSAEESFGRQKGLGWWALNPLLIYICYICGQFDIIPAFLITLAAYFAFKQKNILAMFFLGAGAVFKAFPLFLIFPFSFYLGRDIKKIIKYIIIGFLPVLIIVGPYWFLSSGKVMSAFFSERISSRLGFVVTTAGIIRPSIFIFSYLILCLSLLKESVREKLGRMWPVKVSFFTLALLFITLPISFHYFLWITPFILILGYNSRFRIMNLYLLVIFSLALSTLAGKGMWFGLFSPIYPEFFIGLPGLDEIINQFLPYVIVKNTASLIFIGSLAWISVLVLKEKGTGYFLNDAK